MNVLAGSLYGMPIAVPFIALASTLGSSGSFWLSKFLLKVQWLQLSTDLVASTLHDTASGLPSHSHGMDPQLCEVLKKYHVIAA